MADLIRSEAVISLIDFNGKIRQVSIPGSALVAATYTDVANDANSVMNAIELITLGNTVSRALVGNREYSTIPTQPTNPNAQANDRWILVCKDGVTGRKYQFSVPTRFIDAAHPEYYETEEGITHMLLVGAGFPGLALKTAIDEYAPLSPVGNQMTLVDVFTVN